MWRPVDRHGAGGEDAWLSALLPARHPGRVKAPAAIQIVFGRMPVRRMLIGLQPCVGWKANQHAPFRHMEILRSAVAWFVVLVWAEPVFPTHSRRYIKKCFAVKSPKRAINEIEKNRKDTANSTTKTWSIQLTALSR